MVFLDLDGTLVDPKPGITSSVIHALTEIGLPAPSPDDLEWVIGPPLLDSFARLGAPDPAAALEIYRARYAAGGLFEAQVYPGVPEALERLAARGHELVLATAKPHVFATRITAKLGLSRYFRAQFGPELDGTRNNKAELLAHALPRVGGDPDRSVMVGDRHHDRDAAQANGMAFVAVTWGYGNAAEHEGATATCADPSELPDVLSAILSA